MILNFFIKFSAISLKFSAITIAKEKVRLQILISIAKDRAGHRKIIELETYYYIKQVKIGYLQNQLKMKKK